MEQRTCDVSGIGSGLTCWYVDPARAQGSTGWRAGTYNPDNLNSYTPLPKPFYVLEANGREYRYWLPVDTGYDIGITGHKPVTANARTSLTWEATAPLCDRTAGRGQCGGGPRVASTPWGPRSGDPFGSFDGAEAGFGGLVRVTGWIIDPDTNDPVDAHVYVDGQWGGAFSASAPRPDVAAAVPGYGDRHGLDVTISMAPGAHSVCVYAINTGPFGDTNPSLGCRSVTVSGDPGGNLETAVAWPAGVRVGGWALDPDSTAPIDVQITVDGVVAGQVTADGPRPDVAAAFLRPGTSSGFDTVVPTGGGLHQVCVTALDVGSTGGGNRSIGCRSVTVSGDPIGNLDSASVGPGRVTVTGWAFDPDTSDASVQLTVDGVPVLTTPTDQARSDVAAAYPGRGSTHGFQADVPVAAGSRTVCATAVNQGGGTSRSIGCRTVTVGGGNPIGNFEAAVRGPAGVRLVGWVLDPDTDASVAVHVYVGTAWVTAQVADGSRPDVAAAYPGWGAAHGFDLTVAAVPGESICVYAINVGTGTTNPLLQCRTA